MRVAVDKVWLLLLPWMLCWPALAVAAVVDFAGSGCGDNGDGTWTCNGNVVEDFSGASSLSCDVVDLDGNIQTPGITFAITGPWQRGLL